MKGDLAVRLDELSAVAAAAAIRRGELDSEALVGACLARIAEAEHEVQAWAWLDPEHALAQARAADDRRGAGEPVGPLHGVPVGVKDIFDTVDMPTENGTVLHAGRRPREDATAVALLRAAGAVILGKTVTNELAVYTPGKTRNPRDPLRTPGGSSSGSAAAVAASMVPLALGTQTNGSVIRPASYCGVFGFKPSHGSISRHGVLKQSRTLDHVGMFARSIDDLVLLARPLFVADGKDADVAPDARLDLGEHWTLEPMTWPRIAFVKTPVWEQATPPAKEALAALVGTLGDLVREVELPALFDSAHEWHRTIMEADMAASYEAEYTNGKERLSAMLREMIERGQRTSAVAYSRAQDGRVALRRELDRFFADFDAILTPGTQGVAPLGLASTGSPVFCTIWSLCGVPAISLPMLSGEEGLPIGAQLVGPRQQDARLLRIAHWLVQRQRAAAGATA